MKTKFILFILIGFISFSCKKDKNDDSKTDSGYNLVFELEFDSTQVRLDNLGNPSVIPSGHAAQSPVMNSMSAHYIELVKDKYQQVGSGLVLYKAAETEVGGENAIDFQLAKHTQNGKVLFSIPLSKVTVGEYEYLRISVGHQNYDVKFLVDTTITYNNVQYPINQMLTGTISSFIGFNNYITNFNVKHKNIVVNGNKKQGYWAFESGINILNSYYEIIREGQSPEGSTTVVNSLFATSPIPAGSCLVTTNFNNPLKIFGNETKDIRVKVSFSTNKSFEWQEKIFDGKWEPLKDEKVVDMGIRGMKATVL